MRPFELQRQPESDLPIASCPGERPPPFLALFEAGELQIARPGLLEDSPSAPLQETPFGRPRPREARRRPAQRMSRPDRPEDRFQAFLVRDSRAAALAHPSQERLLRARGEKIFHFAPLPGLKAVPSSFHSYLYGAAGGLAPRSGESYFSLEGFDAFSRQNLRGKNKNPRRPSSEGVSVGEFFPPLRGLGGMRLRGRRGAAAEYVGSGHSEASLFDLSSRRVYDRFGWPGSD